MKTEKDKVKQIKEIEYSISENFGETIKTICYTNISIFNRNGNIIEHAKYNSDGTLDYKQIYKYEI